MKTAILKLLFSTRNAPKSYRRGKGDVPERQTVTEIGGFEEIEDDGDLPFKHGL